MSSRLVFDRDGNLVARVYRDPSAELLLKLAMRPHPSIEEVMREGEYDERDEGYDGNEDGDDGEKNEMREFNEDARPRPESARPEKSPRSPSDLSRRPRASPLHSVPVELPADPAPRDAAGRRRNKRRDV